MTYLWEVRFQVSRYRIQIPTQQKTPSDDVCAFVCVHRPSCAHREKYVDTEHPVLERTPFWLDWYHHGNVNRSSVPSHTGSLLLYDTHPQEHVGHREDRDSRGCRNSLVGSAWLGRFCPASSLLSQLAFSSPTALPLSPLFLLLGDGSFGHCEWDRSPLRWPSTEITPNSSAVPSSSLKLFII